MVPLPLNERIDSLKAGSIGAIALGVATGVFDLLNHWIHLHSWGSALVTAQSWFDQGLTLGFAIISGFLFGVTYRYILRDDPNPHLRTGAIAAFGLIRGFAQIDAGLLLQGNPATLAVLAGESMAMMAIAATGLYLRATKAVRSNKGQSCSCSWRKSIFKNGK